MSNPRPVRADAQRNRTALVTAAREAFAAADDAVPLEGVARSAGVGIGTLYRHFPTREALVEAVYAAELDDVTASVTELLARLPADEALRAWMDRYAQFATRKRGLIATLRAGWTSGRLTTPETRQRITAAIAAILDAGVSAGSLRADVEADDVTTLVLGVFLSTAVAGPDTSSAQVGRLLDLLVDGLRVGAAG